MKFGSIFIAIALLTPLSYATATEKETISGNITNREITNCEFRTAFSNLNNQPVRMLYKPLGVVLEETENMYVIFDYLGKRSGDVIRPKNVPTSDVKDGLVIKLNGAPHLIRLQDHQRKDYEILKKAGKNLEIITTERRLTNTCKYLFYKWQIK